MKVFVYGTLMRGEYNHSLLLGAEFIREAQTKSEFALFDLGHFPGMVPGGKMPVKGEIYKIDDSILKRLDRLEGHPDFYKRTTMSIDDVEGDILVYLLPIEKVCYKPLIVSGCWKTAQKER